MEENKQLNASRGAGRWCGAGFKLRPRPSFDHCAILSDVSVPCLHTCWRESENMHLTPLFKMAPSCLIPVSCQTLVPPIVPPIAPEVQENPTLLPTLLALSGHGRNYKKIHSTLWLSVLTYIVKKEILVSGWSWNPKAQSAKTSSRCECVVTGRAFLFAEFHTAKAAALPRWRSTGGNSYVHEHRETHEWRSPSSSASLDTAAFILWPLSMENVPSVLTQGTQAQGFLIGCSFC